MYIFELSTKIENIIDNIIPKQKPVMLGQFRRIMARVMIALEVHYSPRIDDIDIARTAYTIITSGIIHCCEQHPTDLNCSLDEVDKTIQEIHSFLIASGKDLFNKF